MQVSKPRKADVRASWLHFSVDKPSKPTAVMIRRKSGREDIFVNLVVSACEDYLISLRSQKLWTTFPNNHHCPRNTKYYGCILHFCVVPQQLFVAESILIAKAFRHWSSLPIYWEINLIANS